MMYSIVPTNLSEKELLYLEAESRDNALCNGLIKRSISIKNDSICELLPITLFPTPFPREKYQFAKDIQQEVNLIMHRVAYNDMFLMESLAPIIKIDDFTNNLYKIYENVLKSGRAQNKSLGLFRSDYMLDDSTQKLLQIEVNAISVSFAGLTPNLTELHKANLTKCGIKFNEFDNFPDKHTSLELAEGLQIGLNAYGNSCLNVLFLIEEGVINLSDQKHIEFNLKKWNPKINTIRRTFGQLENELRLDENRILFVEKLEIGVVYFRHGYSPSDYSQTNINLRTKIELSKAIKCPTIQHHLAGVKKIQQILTDKDILKQFCTDNESLEKVYSTFAGIWPLSLDEKGDQTLKMALANPTKFVLKPQREGGGNNYYANEIIDALEPIKHSKQRESYILMDLIVPKQTTNYILNSSTNMKQKNFKQDKLISELGIFGCILGDGNTIYNNFEAGCLLRSKPPEINEGGIVQGSGVLDSVFLY